MNPNPVSTLEIWHLGNGQGHAGALDANLNLGANQIEAALSAVAEETEIKSRRKQNTGAAIAWRRNSFMNSEKRTGSLSWLRCLL